MAAKKNRYLRTLLNLQKFSGSVRPSVLIKPLLRYKGEYEALEPEADTPRASWIAVLKAYIKGSAKKILVAIE